MVVDFAFDRRGALYVLEYDTAPLFFGAPGRLTLVRRNGTRVVLSAALTSPTGVTVGPDGAVYVSNFGNRAAVGQVLRFDP
jgi:streptogramin lyase